MRRWEDVRRGYRPEHGEVTPRRRPVYPISAERELARVMLAYTELAIKVSQPYIDQIMRQYEDKDYHEDSARDFITVIRTKVMEALGGIQKKKRADSIAQKGIEKAGRQAQRHSVNDWNDQVRDALGAEIKKEYYQESMEDMMQNWIRENVSKIRSVPSEYLQEIEAIIRWGYETRQPKVNVYRRLEKNIGLTKSKARMIARDQLGTLNCQMTRYEHESAGVGKYKWITKRDGRVRDCHRALHGTIHKWDEPSPMWYMTKSRGIVYTGRYCHPGEDYCCRCCASPVFDLDTAKRYLADKFRPL